MNSVTKIKIEGFVLPCGVNVKSVRSFFIQTEYPEDTFVQEAVVDFNGHEVKVLRYDEDDTNAYVCHGQVIKNINARNIFSYLVENFS